VTSAGYTVIDNKLQDNGIGVNTPLLTAKRKVLADSIATVVRKDAGREGSAIAAGVAGLSKRSDIAGVVKSCCEQLRVPLERDEIGGSIELISCLLPDSGAFCGHHPHRIIGAPHHVGI